MHLVDGRRRSSPSSSPRLARLDLVPLLRRSGPGRGDRRADGAQPARRPDAELGGLAILVGARRGLIFLPLRTTRRWLAILAGAAVITASGSWTTSSTFLRLLKLVGQIGGRIIPVGWSHGGRVHLPSWAGSTRRSMKLFELPLIGRVDLGGWRR